MIIFTAELLKTRRARRVDRLWERGPDRDKDGKMQIRKRGLLYRPNYPVD